MQKEDSLYPSKLNTFVRWSGLLAAIIVILYAVLIHNGVIISDRPINDFSFYLLLSWWVVLGLSQLMTVIKNDRLFWILLIAYHMLAGSYLVFISGFNTPFIIFWLVLSVFSYMHAKLIGIALSFLILLSFILMDIVIWHDTNIYLVAVDLSAFIFVAACSLLTTKIIQTQEISKTLLVKSKAKETLQRDRIQTIVNNLADAILSTDPNGVVKIYNAATLNLLDTNTSLNGAHIDDIMPLFDQEGNQVSLYKELRKSRIAIKRDDLEFRYDENERIRLELTLSPIRSSFTKNKKENHDGYIVIMRDITKAKSLEEERDEFISVTSHELRTPITIAEGTLSNMQMMVGHPNVTEGMLKDAVNTAHDQIVFLANMVNDLSTLSRAERGVADKAEEIDVRELAHKIFDKYNIEATSKGLHLNLDLSNELGKVQASRLYLEELLQNFMTNAIKYTREGNVDIKFSENNGVITFAVKDSGIGISKSDLQKIFQKFYRSEDYRTRETGGTGLGLYIAMKLSHKLGTRINVDSRLNHGSTFSFELKDSTK